MKIRDRLPLLAVLCCFSALLLLPEVSAQAARDAMLLCAQTLIPSLFPFFVLSSLLVQSDVPRLLSRAMVGRYHRRSVGASKTNIQGADLHWPRDTVLYHGSGHAAQYHQQ